jgi:hypothetical protein
MPDLHKRKDDEDELFESSVLLCPICKYESADIERFKDHVCLKRTQPRLGEDTKSE